MQVEATLLIVNYRSAPLAAAAVASARATSSTRLEIVLVDNSCDAAEAGRLSAIGADRVLISQRNLGYAGGINSALPDCSGEKIIISNPDVIFGPRAIDSLLEELKDGVGLTGPRLHWDVNADWILPPAELHTVWEKGGEIVASHSAGWSAVRSRQRFQRRAKLWRADEPVDVPAVSGAVMCVSRNIFAEIGNFDERFQLYFEEIDFMRRLAVAGMRVRYVPAAACRHIYDQSAASSEDAASLFAQSEVAYHRKWSGRPMLFALRRLVGRPEATRDVLPHFDPADALPLPPGRDGLVELSPLEDFRSAAGHFPRLDATSVRIPSSILDSYRGRDLFVRIMHELNGEEVGKWKVKLGESS